MLACVDVLHLVELFSLDENTIEMVQSFRSRYAEDDPGLDGCLLKPEEIMKLKNNRSIVASLLSLTDKEWSVQNTITLPPVGSSINIFWYEESRSSLGLIRLSRGFIWDIIQLPQVFDVIDVVLVDSGRSSQAIYGIQITRSSKPFSKHHTFHTCSTKSSKKLNNLWNDVSKHFELEETVDTFFLIC